MAFVDGMTPQKIRSELSAAVLAHVEDVRDQVIVEEREAAEDAANVSTEMSAIATTAANLAVTLAEALERHVVDRDPTDDDTGHKGAIWISPDQVWIRGEESWHPIGVNEIDTTYVDAQDQALGERIDNEKWWQGTLGAGDSLDGLRGNSAMGLYQYTGTGFPEGMASAPVGSIYVDQAATAGAVRWIKTTGTGTTGWEVEYGDTGWRNISAMFDPPLTSGSIRVRKTAESVQFLFYYAVVPDGAVAELTSSFGTGTSQNAPIYSSGGANSGTILSHYSGRFTVQRTSTTINYGFILPSATAWPSVLPGTPI